jgi:guanidinopropionase
MNPDRRLRPLDPSVSPRFGDVATLLRAPRVPAGPGIDIALVGVPFDLGTNYRTGARGGPAAVREASRTIRLVHPTSRIAPFDLCEVADVGDVAINAMDLSASLTAIEAFFHGLHGLMRRRLRWVVTTPCRCPSCASSPRIGRSGLCSSTRIPIRSTL